jgi:hypothetical protein
MAESFDAEAMIDRYRERAEAVRKRNLPPVGGDERAKTRTDPLLPRPSLLVQ